MGLHGLTCHDERRMPEIRPAVKRTVPACSAVLSLCISVGGGTVFGLCPAMCAARPDLIVALRHE